MRTTTRDPPRPRVARKICGLALTVGTAGGAHQQLTNTNVAIGVIVAAVVVATSC